MKKKILMLMLSTVMTAGLLVGCGKSSGGAQPDDSQTEQTQETGEAQMENRNEMESTAMYVPIDEDKEIYIFVDQETNAVFTITFPEEIYDASGNKITKEELAKGNIVKLYGDGIMLESYPGQYPGISKIEVIEAGTPEDAAQYQSIVDEIYQEPDPAEPPTLNIEYTTDLAAVTSAVNRGGYQWTYMDKDGLSNAVVGDYVPVLNWGDELIDIKLEKPLNVTLRFSEQPIEVEAVRYEASLLGAEEIPEGEEVTVQEKEGEFILSQTEPGYVYEITGVWENGRADYGFIVTAQE